MLILIGAEGKDLNSNVSMRFGHSNYFLIFNTETKSVEAYENVGHNKKHENLRELINKGVEVTIVGNIGPHAFETINTSRNKIYLARKMSVKEAIEKFLKGELKQLSEPTAKKSIGHKHSHHNHHND
ncbi:MAG: NifB/NifX family molybdenum-iron cluster-binding protein [Ignavibacteria bacterium]|nr:NifB/NifX family molybdenum-iron cluster-binding protein [Ignavibacteria bacterium]